MPQDTAATHLPDGKALTEEALITALLEKGSYSNKRLSSMTTHCPGALRFLLESKPERRLLEIGAGPDSLIRHLAETDGFSCLMDPSLDSLAFSRRLHRAQGSESLISYLQLDLTHQLPFDDSAFDCVLINLNGNIAMPGTRELAELRRIIGPGGQLMILAENRLSFEKTRVFNLFSATSLSAGGYAKLLVKSGFPPPDIQALVYHDSDLKKVIRFTGNGASQSYFPAPTAANLKTRLKQGRCATDYAVISNLGEKPSLLTSIVTDITEHLNAGASEPAISLLDHEITRKEKIVLFARWNSHELIIKLPLSGLAASTESNNAKLLKYLDQRIGEPDKVPKSVVSGRFHGNPYFVESMLSGVALSDYVQSNGRAACIGKVSRLLEQMTAWQEPTREAASSSATEFYGRFIQGPIDTIGEHTGDTALTKRLEHYFQPRLGNAGLKTGLNHGDFSVSNLRYNKDESLSVIDWETADKEGIPALDAINFLDSLQRCTVAGARINQTIPMLANRQWPEAKELRFLDSCYEMYGIDPGLHEPLVYLRWLRHMGFLIRFWLRFDQNVQRAFIYDVADNLGR